MIFIRLLRFLFRWLPWALAFVGIYFLWQKRIDWFKGETIAADTVTHFTILQDIESLGKLELVRYRFKDVTELREDNGKYLGFFDIPDSKVALITSGEAVGCIDLRNIEARDIIISGDTVLVQLPPPELCYYKLDLANSKIYSVDKQVYFKSESQLLEKAYRKAEIQMKNQALKSGILEQTTDNAESVLRPLLEKTSGKRVLFTNRTKIQNSRNN
jgi:hypothetical protein